MKQRVLEELNNHDRTAKAVFVLVLVLTVGVTGAAYLQTTGNTYTSGATFGTDSGLSVQFGQNQTLDGNPFSDEYTFEGDGGTVSATSTGDAYLRIETWGAGAATTDARDLILQNTTAVVNPDNSSQLGLAGGADSVTWDNVTLDDGASDFTATLSGGDQLTVVAYGGSAGDTYRAVNASGNTIATTTADSSGRVNLTVEESGTYRIDQYDNELPTVDNLAPDGTVVESPITLAADVDDDNLPDQNVTVTFRVEGTTVDTQTIGSAQRVNYTLTQSELPGPGESSWSVTATGPVGAETTASSSFFVPGNVTVRNVSQPSEVVTGATATIYYGDTSETRSADANGNISLKGLPANELLVFEVEADNYSTRTMAMPSIVQASDIYLLSNATASVTNRFTIEEPTGSFGSDSVIYIERPITINNSTSYRVVAGDEFGVEGFDATLEDGQRYRIRIVSSAGAVAEEGKYTASTTEVIPLRPSAPVVNIDGVSQLTYNASVSDGSLHIDYLDPDEATTVLTVSAVARFNDSDYLLEPQTYYGTNSLSIEEAINKSSLDKGYVVTFEGQRNGDDFTARVYVGPDTRSVVPGGLSQVWLQAIGVMTILLVGGVFSELNVGVGAVVTSIVGGLMWYVGLLGTITTWGSVAVAITFSVVYAMVIR